MLHCNCKRCYYLYSCIHSPHFLSRLAAVRSQSSQPLGCRTTVQSGRCKSALHVRHELSLLIFG